MSRPLSPIERMIDAACGITPGEAPPAPKPKIKLRCSEPGCKEFRISNRSEIDPPNAVVQEYPCPKHQDKGKDADGGRVRYFDAEDVEIPFPVPAPEVLYYGCVDPQKHGHGLYSPHDLSLNLDHDCQPWRGIDMQLLKQAKMKDDGGKDGRWVHDQLHGWSIVSFWDRSGVARRGSNSAFLVQATMSAQELWRLAWVQWRKLFSRPDFPIRPLLVQTKEQGERGHGLYRGYDLTIFRDQPDDEWYMIVHGAMGYACDGGWKNSQGRTLEEAFIEALRASCEPPAPFVLIE